MKVSFMISNGGPHPADKWAEQTTETVLDLIQISEEPIPADTNPAAAATIEATRSAARQAKRDLRPILFGIFNDHHDGVQRIERSGNASVKGARAAADHVEKPIDVEPHLTVMDQVKAALAATPFASHFAKPEVIEVVKQIVGQHTADVMHIERKWHHDRQIAAAKGA